MYELHPVDRLSWSFVKPLAVYMAMLSIERNSRSFPTSGSKLVAVSLEIKTLEAIVGVAHKWDFSAPVLPSLEIYSMT